MVEKKEILYSGSCLCGKIIFEIFGGIQDIVYCHCSRCRKVQGSAFTTNGNVRSECLTFISGEDELSVFEATPETNFFLQTLRFTNIEQK